MSIFQFPTRRAVEPETQGADWTEREMKEFFRALRLLNEQGIQIGLEQGRTDVGDPWLVFFDFQTQDVFLHIARFDGRCVLICEHLSLSLQAPNVFQLVEKLEDSVREYAEVRSRPSNVIVHPAARIIMSISAVYLFFKLDSDSASAKSVFSKDTTLAPVAGTVRHTDHATLASQRAHLARIFEATETPFQAAVVAGFIATTVLLTSDVERTEEVDGDGSAGPAAFVSVTPTYASAVDAGSENPEALQYQESRDL